MLNNENADKFTFPSSKGNVLNQRSCSNVGRKMTPHDDPTNAAASKDETLAYPADILLDVPVDGGDRASGGRPGSHAQSFGPGKDASNLRQTAGKSSRLGQVSNEGREHRKKVELTNLGEVG